MRRLLTRFGRKTWIIAGAIIIVIVILLIALRGGSGDQAEGFQTEEVKRGDLTATVGATGTVRARQSAVLNWGASGIVEAVYARVGDIVEQGQVLAVLDKTSLPQNVILAEADLVEAQQALDDLMGSDTARAEALIALKKAQDDYQSAYNYRVELNKKGWFKKVVVRTVNHQPVAEIKWYRGYADTETIAKADDQLALRKAQLEDAQRTYDRLEGGPNPSDVAAAEARVAAAMATFNLSKIIAPFAGTVTQAEAVTGDQIGGSSSSELQSIATQTSGGDTTKLEVGVSQPGSGEQVTQGELAFRVDDLSSLLVDVQISEVDINTVDLDQAASLSFDAILDKTYHGKVIKVSQAGDTVEGVVNFTVTIELTDADELVKPGMTSAVNIVVTELKDVLLVPNRAIRTVDGERVVYRLQENLPVPVELELGQSSDSMSIVVGGDLEEGDLVILNPPSQSFGPFGG